MGRGEYIDPDEWERQRAKGDVPQTPATAKAPSALESLDVLAAEVRKTNALLARQNEILIRIGTLLKQQGTPAAVPKSQATNAANAPRVASDRDLDGEHGNPRVKYDPRNWKGESCVTKLFSECPPEYLEILAEILEWQAANPRNEKEEKGVRFKQLDAARARGWAIRLRSGWGAGEAEEGGQDDSAADDGPLL